MRWSRAPVSRPSSSPRSSTGAVRVTKSHTLLLGVVDLLVPGRHLLLGAAVDDRRRLRSEADGGAHRVHRRVAAAEHGDPLVRGRRRPACRTSGQVRLHQVDPGEELVGRVDADQVLARDVHEARQPGSDADEDGIEPSSSSSSMVSTMPMTALVSNVTPSFVELLDLGVDDLLGQAELGDPVDEHAARARAAPRRRSRRGPAWARSVAQASPDGPLPTTATRLPVRSVRRGDGHQPVFPLVVGDEALEVADGDRLVLAARARRHPRTGPPGGRPCRRSRGASCRSSTTFAASAKLPSATSPMNSSIRTPTGQPSTHFGRGQTQAALGLQHGEP